MKLHFLSLTVCAFLLGSSVWAAESSNAQAELARIEAQLAKNPGDVDLQVNRGIVLGELRRYEDEIAQANKLIANKVALRKAYLMQEHGLLRLKRYPEALSALNSAFLHGAPTPSELVVKANLLISNKQYAEALALSTKVISLTPDDSKAYRCRADCYFQLYGACEKCISDLEKCVALDPARQDVRQLLGEVRKQFSTARQPHP